MCFFLQMFEDIIQQWQDNSLNLADYGLDFIPAPLQMISRMASDLSQHQDKPTPFQNNLLKGIEFLQYRIDRSRDADDRITKVRMNGATIISLPRFIRFPIRISALRRTF